MYLSAAIIPPLAVRQEIAQAVAGILEQMDSPVSSRWRDRFTSRTATAVLSSGGVRAMSIGQMSLSLTRFGYVDPAETERLRANIAQDAALWRPPRLHIGGQPHLEGPRGPICLPLEGEVDLLHEMFAGINSAAQRAGFMQDRRSFQPMVPVVALRQEASAETVAELLAGLEGFTAPSWEAEVITLSRPNFAAEDADPSLVATIVIGER